MNKLHRLGVHTVPLLTASLLQNPIISLPHYTSSVSKSVTTFNRWSSQHFCTYLMLTHTNQALYIFTTLYSSQQCFSTDLLFMCKRSTSFTTNTAHFLPTTTITTTSENFLFFFSIILSVKVERRCDTDHFLTENILPTY